MLPSEDLPNYLMEFNLFWTNAKPISIVTGATLIATVKEYLRLVNLVSQNSPTATAVHEHSLSVLRYALEGGKELVFA
jgi:hypothetical protein